MNRDDLVDALAYLMERTDLEPGLTPDQQRRVDELFALLQAAAASDADLDLTALAHAVQRTEEVLHATDLSSPRGFAAVLLQTAREVLDTS